MCKKLIKYIFDIYLIIIKMEDKEKFICENMENIKILTRNNGHKKSLGKDAGKYKNPYWLVEYNDEQFYIMFCEKID